MTPDRGKIPFKPAAYVRISVDREEERAAVRRQREDCEAWRLARGWPELTWYEDNDASASKEVDRPDYDRLWAGLRSGTHDGLLILDADRFTRKPIENEVFIDLVQAKGIILGNILGDVDLSTANGRMLFRVKSAVARQEAERIGERVSRAKRQHAEEGGAPQSGIRPYGYGRKNGTLVIIPGESKIIREMVRRVRLGEGLNTIAVDLNRRAIPTVTGAVWRTATIRSILAGPTIAGYRNYLGRSLIKSDKWKPIITQKQWESVCYIIRHGKKDSPGWNARVHLLSGFVVCSLCGNRMPVRGTRYTCAGDIGGCGKVSRNKERVDSLIIQLLLSYLGSLSFSNEDSDRESSELEDKTTALESKVREIQKAYDEDRMELDDYLDRIKLARGRLAEVKAELAGVAKANALKEIDPVARWNHPDTNLSQRRALVAGAIRYVVIKPQGKGYRFNPANIEVVWA